MAVDGIGRALSTTTPRVRRTAIASRHRCQALSAMEPVSGDWSFPRFFRVVVEAEEDTIGILNVGDPMSISRCPHVFLHELLELRIVFQFRDGLAVDPKFSRRGRDPEFLESLERLRYTPHPDLKVIERFS